MNYRKRLAILPVDNQDRQRLIDDPVNKIQVIHNYFAGHSKINTSCPKIAHTMIHI
ncbi:hypothetical protein THOG05_180082 [Vibrio rotiferianus]|nr:hypothetical protein THOG05_180082 [Vibrio rotiferianus]CAH1555283.1 hypothetical protein THOE12_150082 [Vibrio rotiferianus]CAH1572558.1 hypothetical protein THOG10_200038 [Vibrio rotiferianus]CAH1574732.1 hypothetical protein THOB06_200063 [Vibrio rotiferianus]